MDSFNFSAMQYSNTFFCVYDGDDIVQTDSVGNRKVIGKKLEAYEELEKTTTEYYNKLVELGVIVPPADMQEKWEKAHKEYVENVAWVKQMLLL